MTRRRMLGLSGLLGTLASLSACTGAGLVNGLTSRSAYRVVRDIRYAPGERGTYDLYVPDATRPDAPVVVFFYGGSWDSGSKDLYLFLGQSLASAGIVAAIPNYRLYPEVTFPGFVEDGAAAVAAVRRLAADGGEGIARGRHPLILMGHSAGAEIAALLAVDAHYLRRAGVPRSGLAGFVGLAGPYDFLPLTDERYKRIFPPAVRDASQPVNFIDGSEPPMLLIAGDADTTVDPRNTQSLARKVRAKGGSAAVLIRPGVDHIGAVGAMATALPFTDKAIRPAVLDFIGRRA